MLFCISLPSLLYVLRCLDVRCCLFYLFSVLFSVYKHVLLLFLRVPFGVVFWCFLTFSLCFLRIVRGCFWCLFCWFVMPFFMGLSCAYLFFSACVCVLDSMCVGVFLLLVGVVYVPLLCFHVFFERMDHSKQLCLLVFVPMSVSRRMGAVTTKVIELSTLIQYMSLLITSLLGSSQEAF